MSLTKLWWLGLLWFGPTVACAPTGIPQDEFVEQTIQAQCNLIHNRCCNSAQQPNARIQKRYGSTYDECLKTLDRTQLENNVKDAESRGQTYDAFAAKTCLDAYSRIDCQNLSNQIELLVCNQIWNGTKQEGEKCQAYECAKGLDCRPSLKGGGRICMRRLEQGEPCNINPYQICNVQMYLTCDPISKTCVPFPQKGASCRLGTSLRCDPRRQLHCNPQTNTCDNKKPEGSACSINEECLSRRCGCRSQPCGQRTCQPTRSTSSICGSP